MTERYGLRTVHKFGHVAELLFTFGLAYVIEEIVHLIWGRAPVDYRIPAELDFTLFTLFTHAVPGLSRFHDAGVGGDAGRRCTWCSPARASAWSSRPR